MRFSQLVSRGCLCLSIWVGSAEIELAQRYFEARKRTSLVELQSIEPRESQESRTQMLRWAPLNFAWRVGVRLTRPVRGDRATVLSRETSPDLMITYRVIKKEIGPVFRWVVRLTSESWPKEIAWEQMILPTLGQVRVRPCWNSQCGPWREMSVEGAIPTAGHRDLLVGIQSHLFLTAESLRDVAQESWRSEDFFGREQGWIWPSQNPWPARLWNAQSEVEFLGEVKE